MGLVLREGEPAVAAEGAAVIAAEMKGALYGRVSREENQTGEESETSDSKD